MNSDSSLPVVGISACVREIGEHPFHVVGEKYITAVSDGAECLPLLIPALVNHLDIDAVLGSVDGLMLTGSPSNVHPEHYDGPPSRPKTLHDRQRDAFTLPLIRRALEIGMPTFAICRGYQELNVALGGTLHQHLEEVPGMMDHRRDATVAFAEQYAPRHTIALAPGGQLAALAGAAEVEVNSLHGQGIDRLAPGLVVEATAPDGAIEAVRVDGAEAFALGVQWHPEWRVRENPFYAAIFKAFGDAARAYARARQAQGIAGKVA